MRNPMQGLRHQTMQPCIVGIHKQACTPARQQIASSAEQRRVLPRTATRGNRADLKHLRSQSPLHDTADELCAVAADLNLVPDDIMLGARATEGAIKALSAKGALVRYRALHFATHGTIAGEIEGTSEPGLILTPPKSLQRPTMATFPPRRSLL